MTNVIQFYMSNKNLYPILSLLSSGVHRRFGAITMAKFWGLILFISWCLVNKAKNLIIYRMLYKFDCGNFWTTLRIAWSLLSLVCSLINNIKKLYKPY